MFSVLRSFVLIALVFTLHSCDSSIKGLSGGAGDEIRDKLDEENLALSLSSPSISWGSDLTPTLKVSGLKLSNGTIRLFRDSGCTQIASDPVTL